LLESITRVYNVRNLDGRYGRENSEAENNFCIDMGKIITSNDRMRLNVEM